jgi:hypothetical protein
MRYAAWINVAIGFWLVIAAFTMHSQTITGVRYLNDLVAGVLLMGFALWYLGTPLSPAPALTATMLVGAWLILSPFLMGYQPWNDIVCGVIAIVVALVNRHAVRPAAHA